VVTLFLLTVFGLLLGAGIKGRMIKAGLDTSLPWNTGRKWWQVGVLPSRARHVSQPNRRIDPFPRHWYQGGWTTVMLR
jgi:hypothetical protein